MTLAEACDHLYQCVARRLPSGKASDDSPGYPIMNQTIIMEIVRCEVLNITRVCLFGHPYGSFYSVNPANRYDGAEFSSLSFYKFK